MSNLMQSILELPRVYQIEIFLFALFSVLLISAIIMLWKITQVHSEDIRLIYRMLRSNIEESREKKTNQKASKKKE